MLDKLFAFYEANFSTNKKWASAHSSSPARYPADSKTASPKTNSSAPTGYAALHGISNRKKSSSFAPGNSALLVASQGIAWRTSRWHGPGLHPQLRVGNERPTDEIHIRHRARVGLIRAPHQKSQPIRSPSNKLDGSTRHVRNNHRVDRREGC